MYSDKTLESANLFAPGYETYVSERDWIGPDLLFEYLEPYVNPGDSLLDLGIGTGLASKPFKTLGLNVVGIDGSEEMLKICRQKQVTEKLVCLDLAAADLDFGMQKYQVVISYALLHMIFDLSSIFQAANRALLKNGFFGFSVIHSNVLEDIDFNESEIAGIFSNTNKDSGILNFRHSKEYIEQLLLLCGYKTLRMTDFIGFKDKVENRQIKFSLYIVQRGQ